MLPSQFIPQTPADFIGPARAEAELIDQLLDLALTTGQPQCFLLLGDPGCGKSALSNFIVRKLGGTKWTTTRLNGKQVGVEKMNELAHEFAYSSMFDGFRVVQFEEVDKLSTDAQVRALTFLDDLPRKACVIATSNCRLDEFEVRFQRRFKVSELTDPKDLRRRVTDAEIEALLLKLGTPPQDARQIATFACGNVGAALQDADKAVAAQMLRLKKAA